MPTSKEQLTPDQQRLLKQRNLSAPAETLIIQALLSGNPRKIQAAKALLSGHASLLDLCLNQLPEEPLENFCLAVNQGLYDEAIVAQMQADFPHLTRSYLKLNQPDFIGIDKSLLIRSIQAVFQTIYPRRTYHNLLSRSANDLHQFIEPNAINRIVQLFKSRATDRGNMSQAKK